MAMSHRLTVLVLAICWSGRVSTWSYSGSKGPKDWPELYPTCNGQEQSPIDIDRTKTDRRSFAQLAFKNYKAVHFARMTANGHTAMLNLPDNIEQENLPAVLGGGLKEPYIFQQLHFHWGSNDGHGSEHTIDSQEFSAELHLVHFNAKYGNFNNALNYSDGLAVFGVFLQASDSDNVGLSPIIQRLQDVKQKGDKVDISEPISFLAILPESTKKFFRYSGSLTTPPCSEIVTWTIFKTPVFLSSAQLAQFRQLTNEEGDFLVNNDRPVQPVNQRTVYYSE